MTRSSSAWDTLLSGRDREVLDASGYGQARALVSPVAVIVIDMTFDFLGDRPEPILKSIARFPNSCGEEGWAAAARLSSVLDAARCVGIPVIYTARSLEHPMLEDMAWGTKQYDSGRPADAEAGGERFPECIQPQGTDVVIKKTKPSGFFGTPLREYLIGLGIRQLAVAGATTGGCVRATVVDAFSYGYRTVVIEDCVVDRIGASHAVALFDMNAKYADLISSWELAEALPRLAGESEL